MNDNEKDNDLGMVVPHEHPEEDLDAVRERFDELGGFAHTMLVALAAQIQMFQDSLKPEEEPAAVLANFGSTVEILIKTIGYRHPHLVVITGVSRSDCSEVQLLQHVSQVNMLLKRAASTTGKGHRVVGFDPKKS